jgi:GNAT superfamily N-acetyltransferase
MATAIVPFDEHHLDDAAALLAARHRADRAREADLPPRFEDAAAAREALQEVLATPRTGGVVALDGGRIAGYLLGSLVLPEPTNFLALIMQPRSARVPYAGHAVVPDDGRETYRRLYAALAPRWNAAGCFAHYVETPAGDRAALDAWFSLGFGRDMTFAVRGTHDLVADRRQDAAVEVHRAGAEDLDVVMRLAEGLWRHHAAAPVFFPFLPETLPDMRRFQEALLADPANAHWLAYRDGRALGMMTFIAGLFFDRMLRPERCVYLFQGFTEAAARGGGVGTALLAHSLVWAREQGHERCGLHFMAANLTAARFWLGHGFRPFEYRLCRVVDGRIAWADDRPVE